ncbi:MAG: lipoprotein [Lachnospiraceae bacterium]|nr:lipoprotein [Lachnospiraceae bacterium]MBR5994231.1 lipoprotein [Lachnospiraceae bacterium]
MRKRISVIVLLLLLTGCSQRIYDEEIYECNTYENDKYSVNVEEGTVLFKETGEESRLVKDVFFEYKKPTCYSLYNDIFYFDSYENEYAIYAVSVSEGIPRKLFDESGDTGGISFLDELHNYEIPKDSYALEEMSLTYMNICGPVFVYVRNYELHSMDLRSMKDIVLTDDCSDIIEIKDNAVEYYNSKYVREKVAF